METRESYGNFPALERAKWVVRVVGLGEEEMVVVAVAVVVVVVVVVEIW